ncbi:MAG: hypothetical protein WCA22_19665 [Candidatus Binatus sp.]
MTEAQDENLLAISNRPPREANSWAIEAPIPVPPPAPASPHVQPIGDIAALPILGAMSHRMLKFEFE